MHMPLQLAPTLSDKYMSAFSPSAGAHEYTDVNGFQVPLPVAAISTAADVSEITLNFHGGDNTGSPKEIRKLDRPIVWISASRSCTTPVLPGHYKTFALWARKAWSIQLLIYLMGLV